MTGVPASSASLAVSLALEQDGGAAVLPMPGLVPYELPQPAADKSSFVLRLPLGSDATLLLGVAALSRAGGSGCVLGLGSAAHPYRTAILDDELTIALTPQSDDANADCTGSPRIVSAAPTALAAAGGEKLQVFGWGFVPGARIVLNGLPLETRYMSAGQLEATTPASARLLPVPLAVELPAGNRASYRDLRYIAKTLAFSPLKTFSFSDYFYYSEAADLDGDKRPDLIFYGDVFSGADHIDIAFQRTPLAFTTESVPIARELAGLLIRDIDGDGDLDLITLSTGDAALYVLKNDGRGKFTKQSYPTGLTFAGLASLHAVDITGDGALDVLIDNDAESLYAFINNGQGGFSAATRQKTTLTEENYSSDVTSFDFDLDGSNDIVLVGSNTLTVLSKPGPVLPKDDMGIAPFDLAFYIGGPFQTADMDGDGITDLLIGDEVGTPYILPSTGGKMRTPVAVENACPTLTFAAGDVNGDGATDVINACEVGGAIEFALQSPTPAQSPDGLQTFSVAETKVQLGEETQYWAMRLFDLDGDNKPELIITASTDIFADGLQVYVYRNLSQ